MNSSHMLTASSKVSLFLLATLTIFALNATAHAATLTVDSTLGNDTTASPDGTPYATIPAAVADANTGDLIDVMPGVHDLSEMLEITESITIRGSSSSDTDVRAVDGSWPGSAKHLIGIYGGTEAEPIVLENLILNANGKSYGVNTYFEAYGILDNVTIMDSLGAALTVNGSTIDATGLTTQNNSWGGVNVDPGVGVTSPSVFILHSGTLSEDTQIWSDGANVNAGSPAVTVDAEGYTKLKEEGTEDSYYWVDGAMSDGAFVSSDGDNVFYTSIQAAIDAANPGDTVQVFQGTYNENLTINKPLTLWGPNADKNPNTSSRNAEAIVNGGSGFTVKPQATDIEIAGFTLQADASGQGIYNVGAEATDISGLLITNNIIEGGIRGVTIESSGNDVVISNNEIKGQERDIHLGDGTWNNLKINGNVLLRPNTESYAIQIFGPGTGSIDGFELKDNEIYSSNNIGANISNGTVSGNTFEVDGAVSLALQIVLHNSTLTNNTFNGNEQSACLQLFGSQFGLTPSSDVTISGNTFTDCGGVSAPFNFALQLSQGVTNITMSDNVIENAQEGINTRVGDGWDLTGANVAFNDNQVIETRGAGANNSVNGILNAMANWWGSADGPNDLVPTDGSNPATNDGSGAAVMGAVDYSDFCVEEDCDAVSVPTTTPPSEDDNSGITYGSGSGRNRNSSNSSNSNDDETISTLPSISSLLNASSQLTSCTVGYIFSRDLTVGSEGVDVTELQRRLTREGVYTGPITGYFGPLTQSGAISYQARMGIVTTGYVGPLTRASLNAGAQGGVSAEICTLQLKLVVLLQQLVLRLQADAANQ